MGRIDVTSVIADPDFVDPMQVITRVPTVDSYGENSLTETSTSTYGVIQPISGRTLQRVPEALRVENLQSFWVRGTIVASATGQYTSILVFSGRRYQVRHIFDWTSWGAGWCEGLCVAEVPAP